MGRVPSEGRVRGSARPGVNAVWGLGDPAETEALGFLGAPQTHQTLSPTKTRARTLVALGLGLSGSRFLVP